jgi:hypothetical protein
MRRGIGGLTIGIWIVLHGFGFAQDVTTVSSCPNKPALPITFQVDCSHVSDPATRQQCKPFAENQACKVFWAYRRITGINLEDSCKTYTYTIYDADKWPHSRGEGGLEVRCGSDYIADYSVLPKSEIGPYDVHEMLHVYQNEIGALPYAHIFFGPAMAEARKEVGDNRGYWDAMTQLKREMAMTQVAFQKGSVRPENECLTAELYIESNLYVENPKNLELFYRKLEPGRSKDMADRQRRFNRMFDLVSGGKEKQYLLSHCPAF